MAPPPPPPPPVPPPLPPHLAEKQRGIEDVLSQWTAAAAAAASASASLSTLLVSPHDDDHHHDDDAEAAAAAAAEWKLRELALSPGGLVSDEIRKRVWPRLAGLSPDDGDGEGDGGLDDGRADKRLAEEAAAAAAPWTSGGSSPKSVERGEDGDSLSVGSEETSTTLSSRVDVDTIERDVLRCTTHLLPPQLLPHVHDGRVRALLRNQQERLAHLINQVLIHNDHFWYYQGYHDVSSVFLATLGGKVSLRKDWQLEGGDDTLSFEVLSQVSSKYYADFLHHNFGHLQTTLKLTVFPLLARFDAELHDLLYEVEIPCTFCLSWILTWFSREAGPHTRRVFDACLASHPLFPLYLSVALVSHPHNRALLLHSEPDFAVLHHLIRTLPQHTFGIRSHDADDPDWLEHEDDDNSVWDSRTVDEAWLRQKIMEEPTPTHRHVPPPPPSPSQRSGSHPHAAQHHPVPIEELIARALEYMKAEPPHQLLELAERYHRIYGSRTASSAANELQDLLSDVPEIHFFQSRATARPPPSVPADSPAYVASGWSEGSRSRKKRQRRQRRRRAAAAVAVAVAAVALSAVAARWKESPASDGASKGQVPEPLPPSSGGGAAAVPLSVHEVDRLDGYCDEKDPEACARPYSERLQQDAAPAV